MKQEVEQYDFFVSYARSDNSAGWITQFVEELLKEHRRFVGNEAGREPKRELKPFFDQHIITTGADWQLYLAHGISHSKLFLAFISPNYFASEWCRKEWRAWLDAEIAHHILTAGVRPIYIVEVPGLTGKGQLSDQKFSQELAKLFALNGREKDRFLAELPPVVKHLRRRQLTHNQAFCDVHSFYNAGLDALRRDDLREVLAQLAHDLDHQAELLARADASLSTVPPYNRNFTGRLDELLALRERLIMDDRTGVIYGVHGLGGIGKTELALTYAHAYASAYAGGRFLIRCEGKSTMREAVLRQNDFTALFKISDEERKQPDRYFAAVLAGLRERIEQLGHVLLVLDNITDTVILSHEQTDTMTMLGPKLHLLATTRQAPPTASKGNWFSLDRLPDEDAMALLEKHRPFDNDIEKDAARRIVKRLGGFTLAMELVAAWLAAHKESYSYTTLADGLGLEDLEDIAEDENVVLRRHHERRLSAVLGPVLENLKPPERRAMEYAALLPPDLVPLPWLRTFLGTDFPEVGKTRRLVNPWNVLWQRLERLALLSRADDETTEPRLMRVHRLVQDLVKVNMKDAERAARQQTVDTLIRNHVTDLKKNSQWKETLWEIEPLEALAWLWAEERLENNNSNDGVMGDATEQISRSSVHPLAPWLLSQIGKHRYNFAEWTKAEPLMRRALAIVEQRYGLKNLKVSVHLNNLAQLLKVTNRFSEAEPLMRRALAIAEQNCGPKDPKVAIHLNNLAQLLLVTDRYSEAEPLMRRALTIYKRHYGSKHPKVAIHLNNLAQLLLVTNRYSQAEPLMRRALAIDEHYSPEHPDVAADLNNLAQLLLATNRLSEAEPLISRALAIDKQHYGPKHPKIARDLNIQAQLLKATNRLSKAESLLRRALAIDEHRYGPEHSSVARDLGNLSALLLDSNRFSEAEPMMWRALSIDKQSYGPEHSRVARDLSNLCALLQATNRFSEAEPLLRQSLKIHEKLAKKSNAK